MTTSTPHVTLEVELQAPFGWPLRAILLVFTWGMYPLLRSSGERHFIRRMDDTGFEPRSGKRVAWSEITAITRVKTSMAGGALSDEMLLRSRRGKASLPLWRVANDAAASSFLLNRVPPAILKTTEH